MLNPSFSLLLMITLLLNTWQKTSNIVSSYFIHSTPSSSSSSNIHNVHKMRSYSSCIIRTKSYSHSSLYANKDPLLQLKRMMKSEGIGRTSKPSSLLSTKSKLSDRLSRPKLSSSSTHLNLNNTDTTATSTSSTSITSTESTQLLLNNTSTSKTHVLTTTLTTESNDIFTKYRKNPIRLLKSLQQMSNQKEFSQDMAVTSYRTFQKMKNVNNIINIADIHDNIINFWLLSLPPLPTGDTSTRPKTNLNNTTPETGIDKKVALTLLKDMCREGRLDLAITISERCGVYIYDRKRYTLIKNTTVGSSTSHIPDNLNSDNDVKSPDITTTTTTNTNNDIHSLTIQHTEYHTLLLPELLLGFTLSGQCGIALTLLETMLYYNIRIDIDLSKTIIECFLNICKDIYQIRKCLRLLIRLNGLSDQESVRILTNTYMRNITFIKGSVSIATLPPLKQGEVVFIGRCTYIHIFVYVYYTMINN